MRMARGSKSACGLCDSSLFTADLTMALGDRIYAHFSKDFERQAHTCGLTTLDLNKAKDEINNEDKVFELIVTAYDLNFASSIASSDPGNGSSIRSVGMALIVQNEGKRGDGQSIQCRQFLCVCKSRRQCQMTF